MGRAGGEYRSTFAALLDSSRFDDSRRAPAQVVRLDAQLAREPLGVGLTPARAERLPRAEPLRLRASRQEWLDDRACSRRVARGERRIDDEGTRLQRVAVGEVQPRELECASRVLSDAEVEPR